MELIGTIISSTIVLAVNKCRDATAEKLKEEGGLTKQAIRRMIERELHDVKSKLEGIAKTDLLTAIDGFEVGLGFLYEAIDVTSLKDTSSEAVRATEENAEVNSPSSAAASVETVSIAKEMIKIDLTELDERATRAISNAKERFKMAREKATAAANNEALNTCDRITALRYRVMATILEALDHPADALPECGYCLKKLHSLPDVRGSFKVELKGGWFNKEERREIISMVCQINHAIYDVTQSAGKDVHLWVWPFVDTGEDKIDPLRDARINSVLQKQGMGYCCVTPWSFGQEGIEEHKLKVPIGFASSTHGEFIIADSKERNVKVFDASGKFLYAFHHPNDSESTQVHLYDVATDKEDNIYVLYEWEKPGALQKTEYGVYMKSAASGQHHEFPLREDLRPWAWYLPSLTVNTNNKILVRGRLGSANVIDMYQRDGQLVRHFGGGKLKNPTAITAADDGRVMVGDTTKDSHYVRMFSEQGEQLFKFRVEGSFSFVDIAFYQDQASKQVLVAGFEAEKQGLHLLVITNDGRTFVRITELNVQGLDCIRGITVTMAGHIGFTAGFLREHSTNPDSESFITSTDAFLDANHNYMVLVV